MKTALLNVTNELLVSALHFPEGCRIVGAEWDPILQTLRIRVEGPNIPVPETAPGKYPPDISFEELWRAAQEA